jgi:hypothetical protein
MYKFGAIQFNQSSQSNQLPESPFKTELDTLVREANSALVVGWSPEDGTELLKWLKLQGCAFEVVEPRTQNCEALKSIGSFAEVTVYNLEYRDFVPTRSYDVVIWRPASLSDTEFEHQVKNWWNCARAVVVEVDKRHWSYARMLDMGFQFRELSDGTTMMGFKKK